MRLRPPRKWIMDRISGDSKFGEGSRPCLPCCWVSPIVGCCPGLCETNCFCRICGATGCLSGEYLRFCCMHLCFMLNTVAMAMIVYASLALSNDFDILTKSSFNKIVLGNDVTKGSIDGAVIHLGLRSLAVSKSDVGDVVIGYDQLCDLEGADLLLDSEDCAACSDMSLNLVISTILAAILILPSILGNVTRMYSGYDVNCQKCFSGILSLLSLGLCVNTLVCYHWLCAKTFHQAASEFDGSAVTYEWTFGWAMILMIAASCIKGLEILINCCVPTPSITRNRKEQITYECIKEIDE